MKPLRHPAVVVVVVVYTPVIAGERSACRSTPPEATASRTIREGEGRPRAKGGGGAAAPGLPGGASS